MSEDSLEQNIGVTNKWTRQVNENENEQYLKRPVSKVKNFNKDLKKIYDKEKHLKGKKFEFIRELNKIRTNNDEDSISEHGQTDDEEYKIQPPSKSFIRKINSKAKSVKETEPVLQRQHQDEIIEGNGKGKIAEQSPKNKQEQSVHTKAIENSQTKIEILYPKTKDEKEHEIQQDKKLVDHHISKSIEGSEHPIRSSIQQQNLNCNIEMKPEQNEDYKPEKEQNQQSNKQQKQQVEGFKEAIIDKEINRKGKNKNKIVYQKDKKISKKTQLIQKSKKKYKELEETKKENYKARKVKSMLIPSEGHNIITTNENISSNIKDKIRQINKGQEIKLQKPEKKRLRRRKGRIQKETQLNLRGEVADLSQLPPFLSPKPKQQEKQNFEFRIQEGQKSIKNYIKKKDPNVSVIQINDSTLNISSNIKEEELNEIQTKDKDNDIPSIEKRKNNRLGIQKKLIVESILYFENKRYPKEQDNVKVMRQSRPRHKIMMSSDEEEPYEYVYKSKRKPYRQQKVLRYKKIVYENSDIQDEIDTCYNYYSPYHKIKRIRYQNNQEIKPKIQRKKIKNNHYITQEIDSVEKSKHPQERLSKIQQGQDHIIMNK